MAIPEPKVVVYSSDEATPSERFIAYLLVNDIGPKGKIIERRMGISFAAGDHSTAANSAAAWWLAELEREQAKIDAANKRGEALEAARALRKSA